ncbi:electron transfer flavoprotein subunit beta [Marinobacter nanhaiticus D15-8W]|uniref:Electron transfer flavoprotein subunit beta n=1 Tax=Marinobacter nanhaiticus D15-8W TaxID=626887 RepID=N6WR19_9GAMM|nr:electron transfer flavoprotein subunit alpha/beta [Marinobacter nanhaiticus]ENO14026.1 electron transfer flavoprotein subunit beta [Marinobacter nanhaiticus D15-8W]BES71404.1 electron transfer flavoprotein subunit beta [Marinobacter nanhaiticus D15-8W]
MWPDTNLKVAALVSVGQHPKSGRARRASQDARAVELGLKMSGDNFEAIHVGNCHEEGLRQYLGMGLGRITRLVADEDADAVPVLGDHLQTAPAETMPDILLTGVHAERGEGSGMTPYLLAERLGWPLVPRIADIYKVENGKADVLQALPRGQRRLLRVPLPFVATVDNAAPDARQYAFGPANRGQLVDLTVPAPTDDARLQWQCSPARPRPKRLPIAKATSAADRFKAATAKPQGQGGTIIREGTDSEKAAAIMALLVSEGVVR